MYGFKYWQDWFFLFKCTSLTFTQQEKYEQHQQRKINVTVCQSSFPFNIYNFWPFVLLIYLKYLISADTQNYFKRTQ